MEISSIGQRIRELRLKKGMTQSDLGDVLNVNKSAISHYEKDERSLPIEFLIKISDFFSVDVKYILGINNIGRSSTKSFKMSDEEIELITEMRKIPNYNVMITNPKNYAKLIDMKTASYKVKL